MGVKDLDLEDAVHYHYDQFPPKQMNYGNFVCNPPIFNLS